MCSANYSEYLEESQAVEPRKIWLMCLKCHSRLAVVGQRNGRTTIEVAVFGFMAWLERADIVCPQCGEERRFMSAPVERGKEQAADASFIML